MGQAGSRSIIRATDDFWYNLPANFDVLDCCWRQFQWTGDTSYVDDPAFLNFYRLTTTAYIRAWDKDGDGIPEHQPEFGNRGLGSYDEGPLSDQTMAGADLLAAESRAFRSYAKIMRVRGDEDSSVAFERRGSDLESAFSRKWWDPKLGRFAGLMLDGRKLNFDDMFWYGVFPLYYGFIPAGEKRDRTIGRMLEREAGGIEIESYLPEIFYRYGQDDAAYSEILKLTDPGKKRREYPEVSFAVIGALAAGLMGVDPDAATRTVATLSRLGPATEWAELGGVAVLGNTVSIRHLRREQSVFTNISGAGLAWRAAFFGVWKELTVDDQPMPAFRGRDESGRDISWVTVDVPAGSTAVVSTAATTAAPGNRPRWSEADAWAWSNARPWSLGCNYIPRTAINTLEMWQAETFDRKTIDQELGWAEALGFNSLRVFLHYLPWEQDPSGYLRRLDEFLAIADRHHIGTLFVLFDDCWNDEFKLGPQPAPRPGVHNSGWVRCPGTKMLSDPSRWGVLESYAEGVVGSFRKDRRVLGWDLYNEPANSDEGAARTLPLLKKVIEWARSTEPSQPLTVGIWNVDKSFANLNRFQAENSDVVSFHAYQDESGMSKMIEAMKAYNRPLLCTEYMARTVNSRFDNDLPLLKARNVGAFNWGLVSGKTQTIFPWGSKPGSPEPLVWFHDIFRPDGTPFAASEVKLIRTMSGMDHPQTTAPTKSLVLSPAFHAWALTPPMGWNSWDSFGQAVTEAEVKVNADFMAAKLAKFGWRYVVVDIEWYEPQRAGTDYPLRSLADVDAYGRFVPAVNKFPSAAGGRGLAPLADYIHGKGLKFGVHIVRGIPRKAVERNTPIEGTRFHAADIADIKDYCNWNTDQWGVDVKRPGASEWYDSLFRQLATWGVDFVKADDVCYRGPEIAMMRRAIDRTGRSIVLSLSYGPMPLPEADKLVESANMWRLLGDLWDYWEQVLPAFRQLDEWTPYSGPGHWPDPDMLPLGHLRFLPPGWTKKKTTSAGYYDMTSHGGREDVPNFLTHDEQRTVMTLWSIARCPLMFGGHLPASDDWTLALITNDEVLAVNQKSCANRQLFHANGLVGWTAEDAAGNAKYLAVFNTSDGGEGEAAEGLKIPVRLAALGLNGPCAVRDLWAKKDIGVGEGEFTPTIAFHGAGLYRLTPVAK